MENRRLFKTKMDADFPDVMVDETLRSKQRVYRIINDLKDQWWGGKQLKTLPVPASELDYTLNKRELLRKDRFDPKADTILEEIKDSVKTLNGKAIKAELEEFLQTYSDLRTKEEEMCSLDRETVLLNLKTELERIESDNLNDEDTDVLSEDSKRNTFPSIKMGDKANMEDTIERPDTFSKGINTIVDSLEELEETHIEMKKAKAQVDGLRACMDIFKMNAKSKSEELFALSSKLSEDLVDMKSELASKKRESSPDLINTISDITNKLAEAKATYDNWKIQEIILSSLVEHRNETLILLEKSIHCRNGKIQKDERERQERVFKSKQLSQSKEYLNGLQHMKDLMNRMRLEMLDCAKQCRQSICKNIEPLEKTLGIFANLYSMITTAGDNFPKDLAGTILPMTVNDHNFLSRLHDTVRRVDNEKAMLTSDRRLIRFVAEDTSYEESEDRPASSVASRTIETQNVEFDLSSGSKELYLLANDLVTAAKRAFLALCAVKKLDVCVGTSYSKLDVIKFDITHQKTYLEARNEALSLFRNPDFQTMQNKDQRHCSKKNSSRRMRHLPYPKDPSSSYKYCHSMMNPPKSNLKSNGLSLPEIVQISDVKTGPTVVSHVLEHESIHKSMKESRASDIVKGCKIMSLSR